MNRKEEYERLLEELEEMPAELEYTVTRAKAKLKSKRRRRYVTMPVSWLGVLFTVFVFLVNSSPVFAYTCGQIPLLKELTQFVALSPSLSAAVENQYVQVIEQEQTQNAITASIEYVIVDQKQVNIFYTLSSKEYNNLDITPEIKRQDGEDMEGFGMSYGSYGAEDGELRKITLDFVDLNVPSALQLTLSIETYDDVLITKSTKEDMLEDQDQEPKLPKDYVAEMTFLLEFDPYYTAQGEQMTMDETFVIDGQTLTLEQVDIYPTFMSITLEDDPNNIAWLKSLEFYVENEKGERFEGITNGITASGDPDSPMMATHRIESPFFSKSEEMTIYITDTTWLDKDREKIKINLAEETAQDLPQDVEFLQAMQHGKSWILTFSGKYFEEDHSYQIWNTTYYDESGKEYHFNNWSSSNSSYYNEKLQEYVALPDRFFVEIPLKNYPYDTVYMSPTYSRVVSLDAPVQIKVK